TSSRRKRMELGNQVLAPQRVSGAVLPVIAPTPEPTNPEGVLRLQGQAGQRIEVSATCPKGRGWIFTLNNGAQFYVEPIRGPTVEK
ncbi:MAG: hypothetical protein U1C72_00880, partial [Candidatus Pacearchaeota archaeon]|nr:hypothetical protein [Candidatus Pacearchaeota archaeon]